MTITTLQLCSLIASDIEARHTPKSYDTLTLCDAIIARCEAESDLWVLRIDAMIASELV